MCDSWHNMTTSDMQPSMSCVFIQLKYHNNEEHEKPVCDTRNTVYHSPWQRNIGGYVWLFFASRGRSCTPVASRLHPPLSSHNAIFSCSSTLHTRAPSEDHSRCISSLFQSDNHFDNLRLCLVLCSFRLQDLSTLSTVVHASSLVLCCHPFHPRPGIRDLSLRLLQSSDSLALILAPSRRDSRVAAKFLSWLSTLEQC